MSFFVKNGPNPNFLIYDATTHREFRTVNKQAGESVV